MHKTVLSIVTVATLSLGLAAGCGSPQFTSAPGASDAGSAGCAGSASGGSAGATAGSAGTADGGSSGSTATDAGTAGSAGCDTNAPDANCAAPQTGNTDAGCNTATDAGTPAPACMSANDCPAGQVCDPSGTCVPAPAPAPLSVTAACNGSNCTCTLHFGSAYVSNATCGEARGGMPGMTWTSGPSITDQNGDPADLELTVDAGAAVPGTYDMSYVGLGSCGASQSEQWAQYGTADQLAAMTPDARGFVSCNWWDDVNQNTVSVSDPSCHLTVQLSVSTGTDGTVKCMFAPAGNMRDYHK